MAWHHHGSDTPTSARAILHHTDQKEQNVLKGSVHEHLSSYFHLHGCVGDVIGVKNS